MEHTHCTAVAAVTGDCKRKRINKKSKKQSARKKMDFSSLLSPPEKDALKKQLLSTDEAVAGDGPLLCMNIYQPYASCMFKPRKRSPVDEVKDIELRGWKNGVDTIARTYKFVAIVTGAPCGPYTSMGARWTRHTCYTKKSKEAAAQAKDQGLLVPLKCQEIWQKGMELVDRNGGRPDKGFPFHTILGILLFDGGLEGEEKKKSSLVCRGFWRQGFEGGQADHLRPLYLSCIRICTGHPKIPVESSLFGEG